MNQKRPVNLELGSLKYPPMAIASILHRISGLVLFILLPMMLYFLERSLASADAFNQLRDVLVSPYIKLLLWAFCTALIYHVLAGIRHITMDIGWAETLPIARYSAVVVIFAAIASSIFLGVWIW